MAAGNGANVEIIEIMSMAYQCGVINNQRISENNGVIIIIMSMA
jgi:hypothetical protein